MKNLFIVALSLLIIIPTMAGDRVTRSLKSFNGIDISNGTEALLVQSDENKIDIEATGIDLKKIKTTVNNGILKISVDSDWWRLNWNSKRKIKVKIYHTDKINSIDASGGSQIKAEHSINTEQIAIDAAGGSIVNLTINSEVATLDISGGAILNLDGKSNKIEIDASGGAKLTNIKLITQNASIDAGGGAIIKLTVNKSLTVEASGGAQVLYGGQPTDTDIEKHSGARVSKM